MEFDELQKIWDKQNGQPLYVMNEKALHHRIEVKKNKAVHITNLSELLLIVVNFMAGSLTLALNLFDAITNIFMYVMSAWMFGSAIYLLISRVRRIKESNRFDRSLKGDLANAISVATYQVWLSYLMRWNTLPIALFCVLGLWEGEKSVWLVLGTCIFFVATIFASKWEHRIYENQKREFEILHQKLHQES